MTREEAKILLPIIQAYAEGKTIQVVDTTDQCGTWEDVVDLKINTDFEDYRIKPEQKYRPFKDAGECWQEMQKHQPIGYTKLIGETEYSFITDVDNTINYSDAMKEYTFADGTPFGIKEEEQLWRGQQYVNLVWSVYLMQNQ